MWRSGKDHYGIVSSGFHWAIALAVVGLVGLGAWMVGLTYYHPWSRLQNSDRFGAAQEHPS